MRYKIFSSVLTLVFVITINAQSLKVRDFTNDEISFDKKEDAFKYRKKGLFELTQVKSFLLKDVFDASTVRINGENEVAIFIDSRLYEINKLPLNISLEKERKGYLSMHLFPLQGGLDVDKVSLGLHYKKHAYQRRFFPDLRSQDLRSVVSEVSVLLFLLLVCFGYYFPDLFSGLFNLNSVLYSNNKSGDNSLLSNSLVLTLLLVFVSLLIGFIAYHYYHIFIEMNFVGYFVLVGLILFLIQAKHLLSRLLGSLFDVKRWGKIYYYESTKALLIASLLFFALLCIIGSEFDWLYFVLILLFSIIWIIKVSLKVVETSSVSLFRIISYLCASEVIPLAVVYSIALDFL